MGTSSLARSRIASRIALSTSVLLLTAAVSSAVSEPEKSISLKSIGLEEWKTQQQAQTVKALQVLKIDNDHTGAEPGHQLDIHGLDLPGLNKGTYPGAINQQNALKLRSPKALSWSVQAINPLQKEPIDAFQLSELFLFVFEPSRSIRFRQTRALLEEKLLKQANLFFKNMRTKNTRGFRLMNSELSLAFAPISGQVTFALFQSGIPRVGIPS